MKATRKGKVSQSDRVTSTQGGGDSKTQNQVQEQQQWHNTTAQAHKHTHTHTREGVGGREDAGTHARTHDDAAAAQLGSSGGSSINPLPTLSPTLSCPRTSRPLPSRFSVGPQSASLCPA